MNRLESSKMIPISEAIGNIFSSCQRDYVGVCEKCGEKIYHTYNGLEGIKKIDFYTQCECKDKQYLNEAIEASKNDLRKIVEYNKARCGFGKGDIADANAPFTTHRGNINAYNMLNAYADQFSKETMVGFYIFGPTGTGKSMLAKKCMKKVLIKGFSAFIINTPTLMKTIISEMNEFKNDTLDRCIDVDLLILDDFGSERGTDFQIENLFMILEARWRENKPIIFTSNLTLDEISSKYDDKNRIYSRITGHSRILRVDGKDMRAKEK